MRSRALLPLALLALASCGREPSAPSTAAGVGTARFDLAPLFQTSGTTTDTKVTTVTVTVYLVNRAGGSRLPISSSTFDPNDPTRVGNTDAALTVTVSFPLQGTGSSYEVEGSARNAAGVALYSAGPVTFTEAQVTAAGATPVTVSTTATYIGPGASATKIVISPRSASIKLGATQQFTAQAFDAAGAVVANAPISWQSSNPSVAAVDFSSGLVTGTGKGSATISAGIEGLSISDAVTVNVDATPTGLNLVSGGGQTAVAGSALANPIVVRVVAGSAPVAGITVNFSASGDGSVSTASAVTDASGQAQVRWTLGSSTGSQTLTVSTAGVSSLSVSATATSNARSVSFVSLTPSALSPGGSSTVLVQVNEPSGALAVGATVTFTASGTGVGFTPASTTTNALGQASSTLSASTVGTYTITATVGASSAQTSITVAVVNSSAATQLVKISGDNQTVKIGQNFGAPIVVEARDASGHPVAGAFVDFGTSTGTARRVTGTDGRASILYATSPQTNPGVISIPVNLFPNSSVAVTFTYTAVP